MTDFLIQKLIPEYQNTRSPAVRRAFGLLSGGLGIFLNLLLFGGKLFAGWVSGSVSVTADAFNNLSDAAASVITMIGFRMAAKKPDSDHPYGHGRIEYISGLVVSVLILLMGAELLKSSVEKILAPQAVQFNSLSLCILGISIFIKLYMCLYNRKFAKLLNSAALKATSADSLSDAAATSAVLLGAILGMITGFPADGWCGAVVSCMILRAGIGTAKDTIAPLLGSAPDAGFIQEAEKIVLSHPEILGVHDLIVHDYGPSRQMISLHAEVPADGNMLQLHDAIDTAERELREQLHCEAVIHMDPVQQDSPATAYVKKEIVDSLHRWLGDEICIHDFRMNEDAVPCRISFDILIPNAFPVSEEEILLSAQQSVENLPGKYEAEIRIDRAYV